MAKSNTLASGLLSLILNNANLANIGDSTGLRGSSTAGSLYVSLHTADVAKGSAQDSNEASYTGYARVAISRSGSAWTVTGNNAVNAAQVLFALCTAGSAAVTHWAIGTASSGSNAVLYSGPMAGAPKAFTATTADTLTAPGHSLIVNDRVVAYEQPGATIPTGMTRGVVYYVKTVSGDAITLSTTQGGSTLDITAAGAGVLQKLSPLAISENITPSIAAGAMSITED